jgi:hypothetical protein
MNTGLFSSTGSASLRVDMRVRTIGAVLAIMLLSTDISGSSGEARADAVAWPRSDIRKQIDRAEYVVLATVIRKTRLGAVDPTTPMG